jgi:hypothetical protein
MIHPPGKSRWRLLIPAAPGVLPGQTQEAARGGQPGRKYLQTLWSAARNPVNKEALAGIRFRFHSARGSGIIAADKIA